MKIISYTTQKCRPFQEEEETVTQRLEPYVPIFYMGALVKTQVENWLSKLFDLQGQIIYVSDQAVLS